MGRIVEVARRCGAMVIGVGDTEQLGAVDAGRDLPPHRRPSRPLAAHRGPPVPPCAGSGRPRSGCASGEVAALAEYDARGRIYHGPQDRVYDDAVMLWVNDYMAGRDSLLMATSNETAARPGPALVRERLAELGQVGAARDHAGGRQPGRARGPGPGPAEYPDRRGRADAGQPGHDPDRGPGRTGARPRSPSCPRQTAAGEWSTPVLRARGLPRADRRAGLRRQRPRCPGPHRRRRSHGDRARSLAASLVYTGATRGREKNTIHVVTGAPDPAQPSRAEREAYTADGDPAARRAAPRRGTPTGARAVPLSMPDRPSDRQLAPWEAVLAQALQQDEPERTALEEMQAAQDYATNTGHLLELSEAYWRLDVVPQIDEMIRQRVSPASTSGTARTRSGPPCCRRSASTRSAAAGSRTRSTPSPPSR